MARVMISNLGFAFIFPLFGINISWFGFNQCILYLKDQRAVWCFPLWWPPPKYYQAAVSSAWFTIARYRTSQYDILQRQFYRMRRVRCFVTHVFTYRFTNIFTTMLFCKGRRTRSRVILDSSIFARNLLCMCIPLCLLFSCWCYLLPCSSLELSVFWTGSP